MWQTNGPKKELGKIKDQVKHALPNVQLGIVRQLMYNWELWQLAIQLDGLVHQFAQVDGRIDILEEKMKDRMRRLEDK